MNKIKNLIHYKFEIVLIIVWLVSRLLINFQLPVYMDEGITAFYANRALKDPTTRFDILQQDKGLLTSWISAWLSGFGISPFTSVRMYAFLCALVILGFMYRVAKELFGVRAGRLIILLFTFSPFNLIHDVVGFLDPGVATVAVLSFYFMMKYFDDKDYKIIIIIGFILGLGTLIRESSFYFILLIPLSIILYEIFLSKIKQYFKLSIHFLLFIGTIYPIYSIKKLTPLSYPHLKPVVENHYLFKDFVSNPFKYVQENFFYYTQVLLGYSSLLLFLFVISWLGFHKLNAYHRFIFLISILWAGAPIAGALLFATLPSSRYIISSYPFLILAVVFSLVSFLNLHTKQFPARFMIITSATFLSILTFSQSIFMTFNLERYTLPGLDDWQYFRAQQLSGAGVAKLVDKIETLSILIESDNSDSIKVLGVNSYNNGILAVLLNEKNFFKKKQVDIYGYYGEPLKDFDFILIEEGDVSTYVSWGWPLAQLTKSKEETQLLPLFLEDNFYSELSKSHEKVFVYSRPRNGAQVLLYAKK